MNNKEEKQIIHEDIFDVNCWQINLMPSEKSERRNKEFVCALQDECIKRGIFGIGMTASQKGNYVYRTIKKGDYVVTKHKNGHYYIGRVSSDGAINIVKDDPIISLFSWYGTVDMWYEFTHDYDIPDKIVDWFSQRFHPTIRRIVPQMLKLMVISMYERKSGDKICNISDLGRLKK